MIVVSNSSPLIIFGRLNRFDLLRTLFVEILISEEVYREVVVQGKGHPGATQTEKADWIGVKAILNRKLHSELLRSYNLSAGEIATIILAQEVSADFALIDERKARLIAKRQGVSVMGSVGILEVGYRKGIVQDLRAIYHEMEQSGVRVDRRILNQSLVSHKLSPL